MKCCQCGKERSVLERTNPKGEPGQFACAQCLRGEPEPEIKGEQMTPDEQLERWVAGESVHNATRDECCPDFSCCQPEMQWAEPRRREFQEAFLADDHVRVHDLLMGGLTRMVGESDIETKVHVTG